MKNKKYHGYGRLIEKDSEYSGKFENGYKHGRGMLNKGDEFYYGDFQSDMPNGFGYYVNTGVKS